MSTKSNEIKIENNSEEIVGRERKVSGGISMTEASFMESAFGDMAEFKDNNSYHNGDSDSEESKEDPSYSHFVDVDTESLTDESEKQSEDEMMFDMEEEEEETETYKNRPNTSNIVPVKDPKNLDLRKPINLGLDR